MEHIEDEEFSPLTKESTSQEEKVPPMRPVFPEKRLFDNITQNVSSLIDILSIIVCLTKPEMRVKIAK